MSRRLPARDDGDAGFTLIEVLVAFFIAALTLTAALRVLSEGTGWAKRGPDAAARLEEAASIVDTLLAAPNLRPGGQDGVFANGHPWHVRVVDVTDRVLPRAAGRLLRVELRTQATGTPLLATAVAVPGR